MTLVLSVALLLLGAGAAIDLHAQASLPNPLRQFLADYPEYRLLTAADVDAVEAPLPGERRPAPFDVGETTGDGLADVVAVVVSRGARPRFGVVAFHASRRGFNRVPIWIGRPQSVPLLGVSIRARRAVTVRTCWHCDANGFLRWNGRAYEAMLWLPGDRPQAYLGSGRTDGDVVVRSGPTRSAEPVGIVPNCTTVTVVETFPRDRRGTRWYLVRGGPEVRSILGFVPDTLLTEDGCIG